MDNGTARAYIANSLWQLAVQPAARGFWRAVERPWLAQERLLQHYLTNNRATVYGRQWGFDTIRTVDEFQRRVPLTTYDEYGDHIDRIGRGEAEVLTATPVRLFEPSSGSTAASKLIPYTAQLQQEFQRGLAPWVADLFGQWPELKQGPAYWSITPLVNGRQTTPAGIPIGFEEDSAYLGALGRLVEAALAVPSAVKHLGDVATFRYVTLLFLLRQADLRLVSVWNPSYLTLLLAPLAGWWDRLLSDIAAGVISPPGADNPALPTLCRRLRPDPGRARALAKVNPEDYRAIWPRLKLISCWADGPAAPLAEQLAQRFSPVFIQPKGLLATEAFVTLPLIGRSGGVLAITAHFFEFLSANGAVRLAHQLERGEVYEVVVTTAGGLYRYRLHDLVEVVDFVGATPCFRFVGKTDRIADRFGEKLHEQFVARTLTDLFAACHITPLFMLLAPAERQEATHYTLYLELTQGQALPTGLASMLDQALAANFHYAYCRQLGQLAKAQVCLVENGVAVYLAVCQERGQKLGNIKPAVLDRESGWEAWFCAPSTCTKRG